MTTASSPEAIVRRLKKEVSVLRQKELAAKNQLKTVFTELKGLGKVYEKKAVDNLKKVKAKISGGKTGTFVKALEEVEKKFIEKVASKQTRLSSIISSIEKHLASQFSSGKLHKASVGKTAKAGVKKKARRSNT